jgi:hypothetical protein
MNRFLGKLIFYGLVIFQSGFIMEESMEMWQVGFEVLRIKSLLFLGGLMLFLFHLINTKSKQL